MTKIVTDGNKYFPNEQLQPADKSGRKHYSSLIESWNPMLVSYFSYSSATRIDIDTSLLKPEDAFQVGDHIRIFQQGDTDYKYFFLTYRGEDHIRIAGGDNFVFNNQPILEIAFSRDDNQIDWPSTEFVYSGMDLVMYPSSGIGASVNGAADAYFSVEDGKIIISYKTTDAITTSGNALNHYCFAEIPDALVVPTNNPSHQVVFPTITIGFADNLDDFLVGVGSLVIFEGRAQLGGDFGQTQYAWPKWAAIRMGPYADHKFGNASNSGNSVITIYGTISYIYAI